MTAKDRKARSLKSAGIKLRATLTATGIVALALILGGIALVALSYTLTMGNLRDTALARANDVVALTKAGPLPSTLTNTGQGGSLLQVIGPAGDVLAASANITGNDPVLATPPTTRTTSTQTRTDLSVGGTGEAFLVVSEPVSLPAGPGWVYVASSIALVNNTIATITTVFLAGLPVILAVVAISTWTAMARALNPVERIRERAAAIGSSGLDELDQRVPVPGTGDEIARLATTMNQMLARLQEAAGRQRRFIGDASHELRSPLTALRTQVDVALAHPAATDPAQVYQRIQHQAQRMGVLIDDLLFLARSDESAHPETCETVDLDELVLTEAHRLNAAAGPTTTVAGLSAARINGSSRDLTRLLQNLTNNAATYATSTVTVALTTNGQDAVLTVTDDGPGIPPTERERIFERFVRLDPSRARNGHGTGTGLGLSIARRIARTHGGDILASDRADNLPGACFTVHLPLS